MYSANSQLCIGLHSVTATVHEVTVKNGLLTDLISADISVR